MDDYTYGKTYLDPEHVKDGGVTHEHVRKGFHVYKAHVEVVRQMVSCAEYLCRLMTRPACVLQVRRWKVLQELQVTPWVPSSCILNTQSWSLLIHVPLLHHRPGQWLTL